MTLPKHVAIVTFIVMCMHSGCAYADCSQLDGSIEGCTSSGDVSALLQGHVTFDGDEPPTASFSLSEGGEALVGPDRSSVQGVHAWLAGEEADAVLSVSFNHQGKSHVYEMFPHDVYHEDAEVYAGDELLDVDPPRTFRLREEGKWASVTLHEDGMVQGLLEDNGRVMEITPVSHQEPSVAAALLQDYEGEAPAHIIRWIAPPQLQASHSSLLEQAEPTLPPDDNVIPVDTEGPGPIEEEVPEIGAMNSWGGVKWFPGCYSGDSSPHEFILSFASDKAALDKEGGSLTKLKTKLDSILNEASFVYEKQMNIKLKIGFIQMDTTGNDFGGCPSGNEMQDKLGKIKSAVQSKKVPEKGAAHIFTGCGGRWGVLGLAYVGTMCRGAYATGSNKIHGGSSPWLTFAHELGHNFQGKHSFEDGQGKTGGVMDYGNGKLNGHYQFNTKYRKSEMCGKMNAVVNKCKGSFQKDAGAPPGPTSPPGTQAPPKPTSPPTTVPPMTGGSKCSFEGSDWGCGVWENTNGDQFDWSKKSGRTPSGSTGPDKASDGNQYLFIETSSPRRNGDKAILQTKSAMKLGTAAALKFDYHMYGRSIDTLKVLVGGDVVFEKKGQQGKQWKTETVSLDTYAGTSATLKFVATRGQSWAGDIAIDNVVLNGGGGGGPGGGATTPEPEPEPEPTTAAPTTMAPTTMPPPTTPEPEPEPTTMAPPVTTKAPEPEPEPTTAPPGGGNSLSQKVDQLEKKADEILKLLKKLLGSSSR